MATRSDRDRQSPLALSGFQPRGNIWASIRGSHQGPQQWLHSRPDRYDLRAARRVLKRAGKGKRLVIENGAGIEANEDLVALTREAFAIRNRFLSGPDDSIEAMSGRLGMNKARLTSLVRVSYLAPEIVRSILEGGQPLDSALAGGVK